MMCFWRKIFVLTIFSFVQLIGASYPELKLSSPDKNLRIQLAIENTEQGDSCLYYQVFFKDKEVIQKSRLGISSASKGRRVQSWQSKLSVLKTKYDSHEEVWTPVYGERNKIENNYNELTVELANNNKARGQLSIVIRAYNEGIAFRYYFAKGVGGSGLTRIAEDLSEFTMPEGTKGYFESDAQGEYSFLPLSEWEGDTERPLTLELSNGLYVSLAEAEDVNFCRTNFIIDKTEKNKILCSMYESVDQLEPFATPWRVIMVAENPGKLIENNDIILNLNPPCEIKETSWIKPGKVMRHIALSTDGGLKLIDFAVEHNLQYIEIDSGWYGTETDYTQDATKVGKDKRRNPKGDMDLQKIIAYGKSKGIGVYLYLNQRALKYQLDKILPVYKSWGIVGLKFGFVIVGSYYWTEWLHEAVRKCAEYGLMVDIHDEYRPTGFSRTYPNLMTQEGIRGNEEMPDATHNTVLPFTRFLAGPADYTYCYYYRKEFGHPDRYIKNTPAHQLALPIVYYSPIHFLFWYDLPGDYQGEPELEFWKDMPTTWDDTKVINAEIGRYVTIARKSGDDWFVGTITNVDSRKLEIPLSFLEKGKEYEAIVYNDDPSINTRTHVGVSKIKVDSQSVLTADMRASGGQAIHIKILN
jgi:alpha-glucosidase